MQTEIDNTNVKQLLRFMQIFGKEKFGLSETSDNTKTY